MTPLEDYRDRAKDRQRFSIQPPRYGGWTLVLLCILILFGNSLADWLSLLV